MTDEDDEWEGDDEVPRPERNRFQRLGDQLTGLLDPDSAFRRGQGLVTGVTNATKEELMRLVGAEVRRFLDKMDIADLAQQIIEGLVVDVNMQVRFTRSKDGAATPEVTRSEASVRNDPDDPEPQPPTKSGPKRGRPSAETHPRAPQGRSAESRQNTRPRPGRPQPARTEVEPGDEDLD